MNIFVVLFLVFLTFSCFISHPIDFSFRPIKYEEEDIYSISEITQTKEDILQLKNTLKRDFNKQEIKPKIIEFE